MDSDRRNTRRGSFGQCRRIRAGAGTSGYCRSAKARRYGYRRYANGHRRYADRCGRWTDGYRYAKAGVRTKTGQADQTVDPALQSLVDPGDRRYSDFYCRCHRSSDSALLFQNTSAGDQSRKLSAGCPTDQLENLLQAVCTRQNYAHTSYR